MTSQLFSPLELGPVRFENRIAVSPMCQYSAPGGVPGAWHLQHWAGFAMSGVGLIMIESTAVQPNGRISQNCLGIYDDAQEEAFTRHIASIRGISPSRFGIQLGHAGRKASTTLPWQGGKPLSPGDGGWTSHAPSALPFAQDWPVPEALDETQMDTLVDQYVAAAGRAERAGIDVAELHAAHGYLIHQFLSAVANRRTDAYGGSREARERFPLRVARALRAAWPRVLGARITATDWMADGISVEDAVAFATALKQAGFDYVCVTSGGISPDSKPQAGPGFQVPFAARIRSEAGIATRAVGMIATPEQAEGVISSGAADMVAIGRGFLDDPRWTWHAAQKLGAPGWYPQPYERAKPANWPGATLLRA